MISRVVRTGPCSTKPTPLRVKDLPRNPIPNPKRAVPCAELSVAS